MTDAPIERPTRSAPARYVVAAAVTAAATLLKVLLPDLLGPDAPFTVYLGGVILAAWYGGMGPGLCATGMSVLAGAYWFAAPYGSFHVADAHDVVRLLFGGVEGAMVALLGGELHRANRRAEGRRRELAEARGEQRREVEARAKAESSLESASADLEHARRMQAIGTLAGGVAHDFSNLLTVILNYTAIALPRLPPGDPARRCVEEIRDAANRAANLSRGLLTFARRGVVETCTLDLRETLKDLESTLRMMLGDGIELSARLEETPAHVSADPVQMEQLLMNLAVNARDAMPEGGRLSIEIRGVGLDPDAARALGIAEGPYVRLTVADSGQGIPDEVRDRIFEPFFTTKEAGRGSGLGLAIVRSVVQSIGGGIRAESTPAGTTFTVHLPQASSTPP